MSSTSFSFYTQVTEAQLWGLDVIKSSKPSFPESTFEAKRIERVVNDGAKIVTKSNLEKLRRGRTEASSKFEVFKLDTSQIRERYSIAKEKEIASKKNLFKVESANNFHIDDVSRRQLIQ